MPLFSHTTALLNNRANSASTVSNGGNTTGSFDAAMESIGTALGELRSGIEGLPNNIEQAFIKAISSDTANESIYDAVASASYDAYSAVQSDHGMASGLLPTTGAKGVSGDDNLPGRSFSLKELFATSEPATAAGDRKRMQDLQQNFYANLAPEFYTKGAKVFDKILAGDLDVAAIADNLSAMGAGDDDGDDETDWNDILNIVSNLLPSRRGKKGKRGKRGKKGKSNKPNKKTGGDKGGKGDNKKITKDNKEKTQSDKKGKEEPKDNKKNSSKKNNSPSKKNPPKKTPTGPKQASNAGQKVATEGTKTAAKTGAKTAAKTGAKTAAKTGGKVAAKTGAKVATKVAAKTALRAVPVVGQVAGAAMLAYDAYQIGSGLKELHDVVGQSKENVKQMNEANLGNFTERQKDKPGGEARIAAFEESQKASAKLHDIQNSAGVLAFANDEKANSALQEYRDIMSGKIKMEGAKEGEPLDREAVKEYALSRIKGIGSGWTKDLAEALIDDTIASDKFNEVLANTSPNGQDNKDNKDNATGDKKPAENAQSGQPGAPGTNDAPMAAGSMENNARETVNAGTGVMTQDIMTAEAQMQQYKQFTFEGIRDALLLPEVQNMFTTTAQTAGAAVEQKLMG